MLRDAALRLGGACAVARIRPDSCILVRRSGKDPDVSSPHPMTPLDIEQQLQHHAAALRGLARDLVRDTHAAEDLVQGTLHAALARGPARPGPLGGWLVTVLRRLHLQRRRGELRRAAHEHTLGPMAAAPSAAEHCERRETIVAVTTEVFRLEEPYQTTVLLRYFEDLTPAQIAARTQTSVATVKSRLQRALALLRGRLDVRLGPRAQWGPALCAAIALPASTVPLLGLGALLMAPATKLTLAAAAAATLLVSAFVWNMRESGAPPAPPARTASATGAAPAPATSDEAHSSGSTDRSALVALATDDAALSLPFGFELEVRVLDVLGLPVEGARVLLAPSGCRLDELPDRTDAAGTARVAWRGRSPSMSMVVATRAEQGRDAMRQLVVHAGSPALAVFGGSARRGAQLRLVGGSPGADGTLSFVIQAEPPAGNGVPVLAVDGLVLQQGAFADNPRFGEGMHPAAGFADVQWLAQEAQQEAALDIGELFAGGSFTIHARGGGIRFADQTAAAAAAAPPPTRLEGTVYGEDGKPCANCAVAWGTEIDRPRGRTDTDANGAFRFDDVPEGALELRAGGGDAGLQHVTVRTMAGQTATVAVHLQRQITVRGRAVAADGKPLEGMRVEWVGSEIPWFDGCTVAGDGSFVLPNLPGGTGRLLLFRNRQSPGVPVLVSDDVLPDSGEVALRLDPAVCSGELQLEPALPEGVDRGAVEARVFQEATGRGTTLRKAKDSNRFALSGLPAGWYRVELGGPGLGWIDAGRHYVDGKSVVDLGRVALPPFGMLRLVLPAAAADGAAHTDDGKPVFAVEIHHRRADCDVRIMDPLVARGAPLPLAPGDYFAIWQDEHGARGVVPFTVAAGREVEVRCGDAKGAPR